MLGLGSVGIAFTWSNNRKGLARVKEKLDKATINIEWRLQFRDASFHILSTGSSDHSPLLFIGNPKFPKLPRPFRFRSMRFRDKGCKDVIIKRCPIK